MPATCPLMSKPDCRQSSFGAHRSGAVTVEAPQHIPFLRPTFLKYVLPSFFINKLSNFASLSLILNSLLWLRSRTQVNPQGFPAAGDKVLGRGQGWERKKLWWKKDILWGYRDLGQRSNKRDPLLNSSIRKVVHEFANKYRTRQGPCCSPAATTPAVPALDTHLTQTASQKPRKERSKIVHINVAEQCLEFQSQVREGSRFPNAYLVHMGMPILIVSCLGLCAIYPGEECGLCQIQQRCTDAKSFGNGELDFLPHVPAQDTMDQSDTSGSFNHFKCFIE